MRNVTVLGSLHLDIVVKAARLPHLGETLIGTGWAQVPGGKGLNQAVACARAGLPTQMLGLVGSDGFADTLINHLQQHQVNTDHVVRLSGVGSGMSVAMLQADGDYAAVVASEANLQLDAARVAQWIGPLAQSDALVLQNEIPAAANLHAARLMASRQGLVVLNAAPARGAEAEFFRYVSVLIVNSVEAEMMGSAPVVDLPSACVASQHLHKAFGPAVVVTAGKHGAAWTDAQGLSDSVAALSVKVISAHGAGDTFVGNLVAQLVQGAAIGNAVVAANAAAAHYVSTARD